ncbi:MAG: PKD domain-containing protein [Methanospirillum sp.]|uniref:PKD domain-containing protein n=1 Tax=Methanospirillum sp. TaxID=45200 RepID=UPI00236F3657|nr:PKD domain-containing protein [Methanospirillum sp.]MDD1728220.1 PKD domain-containing protein [Methanospirillum sp.]
MKQNEEKRDLKISGKIFILFCGLVIVLVWGVVSADEPVLSGNTSVSMSKNYTLNHSPEAEFRYIPEMDEPDFEINNFHPEQWVTDNNTVLSVNITESSVSEQFRNNVLEDADESGKNNTSTELTWQKCFGGSSNDEAHSLIQTFDGGYLIIGSTYSNDGDVTDNHGSADYWVVKKSSSGTIEWEKCFGGSDYDYASSAVQASDGGYLIVGYTYSNDGDVTDNHGSADYWVVKLTTSGALQWEKSFGGSSMDFSRSVIQTADNGYLIIGYTYSDDGDVTDNLGYADYWIVKLTTSGALEWEKSLGGTNFDGGQSAIQTDDNGYLIAGYTSSDDEDVTDTYGAMDYWVVKISSSGTIEWEKSFGGSDDDLARALIQTADNGYLITGYSNSHDGNVTGNHGIYDYWVVKLTPSGALEWEKSLGGSSLDYSRSGIQTADNGYLIAGYSSSNDGNVTGNHGSNDYWVVKLSPSGTLEWEKSLGGSSTELGHSVITASSGEYLVGGYTYSEDGNVVGNHGLSDVWLTLITARYPVNATVDSWTIAYPGGNRSYIEGKNATYLAQAKPGADLVNVSVDDVLVGSVSNWTFSTIAGNHTFATFGQPTPGQVHAFFTLNTTRGASPLTISFTNQSLGNPTSFSWNFGDGERSTDQDPVHTYTIPGTYSVTLKAMNDLTGGIATLNNAVTVTAGVILSPTPTPVPGTITVSFSADQTSGTAPLQVTFIDTSSGNPTSWFWDLGDGSTSVMQNVTHIYTTKGTYSIRLSAQNSLSSGNVEKSGYITVT